MPRTWKRHSESAGDERRIVGIGGPNMSMQDSLIQDLLTPAAYPHAVGSIELRETHLSWIVLTGTYAYKIKKPVKLDFIDASTLERRRQLCEEELRLNRRLVPELYLDVVPIVRLDVGTIIGGKGSAIEYALRMRQFAPADELHELLARREVDAESLGYLAELLAQFHTRAAVAPGARAPERTQRMYAAVFGNLAQLLAHLSEFQPSPRLGHLIDWTHDTAQALEPVLQLREQGGFVRECHGDLHTGNIVRLHDRLVPFDCLEFDPDLRWIDVMNDLAFLVMDLISHERRDLACTLLSRYLEITGDYEGLRVLPFYAVYRALIRAKVDVLMIERVPARATEFRARLQQRLRAAQQWTVRSPSTLVLMHGASGSGKSWLSERLVPRVRAVRIRSDLERKRLAGIEPSEAAVTGVRQGIYAPEFSHRTYARLAECAEHGLEAGLNVIVDAAFLQPTDRAMFHTIAERTGAAFVIVSCQADPIVLAGRVRERSTQHADPSDANLAVLENQLREIAPFDAAEQRHVVVVNTAGPDAVERVAAQIEARDAS